MRVRRVDRFAKIKANSKAVNSTHSHLSLLTSHFSPLTSHLSLLTSKKNRRSISRILYFVFTKPLSFIWFRAKRNLRCLPPLPSIAEAKEAVRATHLQGVHGISTRKVYPPGRLPAPVVRSYRTFSPLPRPENRHAAVIFCDTFCTQPFGGAPSVRRCGALCCPDFPPRKATERSAVVFLVVKFSIGLNFVWILLHDQTTVTYYQKLNNRSRRKNRS